MKIADVYKDILHYRIASQTFYNENLISVRNPEVRQLFTQLRDDEMKAIVRLQQKIDRFEAAPGIIAKILPGGKKQEY